MSILTPWINKLVKIQRKIKALEDQRDKLIYEVHKIEDKEHVKTQKRAKMKK